MKRVLGMSMIVCVFCSLGGVALGQGQGKAKTAEKTVPDTLREILRQQGTAAANWGEDIANPFTNVSKDGEAKLREKGVDVRELKRLEARLLTGEYYGANKRDFVNWDPSIALVCADGFGTHGDIYSLGPILAVGKVDLQARVVSTKLVWFVEGAKPREDVVAWPVIVQGKDGDYGWRRPATFLAPNYKQGAAKSASTVRGLGVERKKLREQVTRAIGLDIKEWTKKVENPFAALTDDGVLRLKARGIDVDRLQKLPARLLTGKYYGTDTKSFLNTDEDLILVVGKGFRTHGEIYSLGPILATDDAELEEVVGADIVWFVEKSWPRSDTAGLPVIFASTVGCSQVVLKTDAAWHGDYGWRRPKNFPQMIP
jgi:hypothetical protein